MPAVRLIGLLLVAMLLAAAPQASAEPAPTSPAAFEEPAGLEVEVEDEEEGEEGEAEESECAEAREELAEGELTPTEVDEVCEGEDPGRDEDPSAPGAPGECPLRSFHPQAAAGAAPGRLKLTIGYSAPDPVGATIEIRSGKARIGVVHRHLGRSGVLHLVEDAGRETPKRVAVELRIAGAPARCAKPQTKTIPVAGSR